MPYLDLERLVCAGAIDKQFRELLLQDPLLAASGYYSDHFRLTTEEKALITSIRTNDFQTFVLMVADWIQHKRSVHPAPSATLTPVQVVVA